MQSDCVSVFLFSTRFFFFRFVCVFGSLTRFQIPTGYGGATAFFVLLMSIDFEMKLFKPFTDTVLALETKRDRFYIYIYIHIRTCETYLQRDR